jgi:hypothetical protein
MTTYGLGVYGVGAFGVTDFRLAWDQPGHKLFETGVDRGVLYFDDRAIPWNGLTGVDEEGTDSVEAFYFDGVKHLDSQSLGDYAASVRAFTYPDELFEIEGAKHLGNGLYVDGQPAQQINMSYRTLVGNDLVADDYGYKIHLVYNLAVVPDDKAFSTRSDSVDLAEFGWKLTAVPEAVPGFRPTAHAIIDSTQIHPYLLAELEEILYGSDAVDPSMPPLADLSSLVADWRLIYVTDNGDGTWTATTNYPEFITVNPDGTFEINNVDGEWIDPGVEYQIRSTTY